MRHFGLFSDISEALMRRQEYEDLSNRFEAFLDEIPDVPEPGQFDRQAKHRDKLASLLFEASCYRIKLLRGKS